MGTAKETMDLSFGCLSDDGRWFPEECKKALEKGVEIRLIVGRGGEEGAKRLKTELNDQIIVKVALGAPDWGLFNWKMALVDKSVIWMGSYNLTHNSMFSSEEFAVKFESTEVATFFGNKFSDIWESGHARELN